MAKVQRDPLDPIGFGTGPTDFDGEGVVLVARGGDEPFAVFLPRSISNLRPSQQARAADLQAVVLEIRRLQGDVDGLVGRLRDEGASWVAIGWCVGTTAEAARQRWSE